MSPARSTSASSHCADDNWRCIRRPKYPVENERRDDELRERVAKKPALDIDPVRRAPLASRGGAGNRAHGWNRKHRNEAIDAEIAHALKAHRVKHESAQQHRDDHRFETVVGGSAHQHAERNLRGNLAEEANGKRADQQQQPPARPRTQQRA